MKKLLILSAIFIATNVFAETNVSDDYYQYMQQRMQGYGTPGMHRYGTPGMQRYGMPGMQRYGMPGMQRYGMPGMQNVSDDYYQYMQQRRYGMPGMQGYGYGM